MPFTDLMITDGPDTGLCYFRFFLVCLLFIRNRISGHRERSIALRADIHTHTHHTRIPSLSRSTNGVLVWLARIGCERILFHSLPPACERRACPPCSFHMRGTNVYNANNANRERQIKAPASNLFDLWRLFVLDCVVPDEILYLKRLRSQISGL